MSKFTKSEWNFSYVQRLQDIAEKENGKYLVAKLNGTPTEKELQAISRLLNATPEMYGELYEALQLLKGKSSYENDEFDRQAKSVQELLARIDGEEVEA